LRETKLPVITLNSQVLSRFDDALRKEWLVTNGLGGYSSSTVLGLNTRKYHGLLVAALRPPGDRTVCLAHIDEDIAIGDRTYRLGVHEFHNNIFPGGNLFLKEFSISPFPTFTFQLENITVKKTIFTPHRKNLVVAIYSISNESEYGIEARFFPLLTYRHINRVIDHKTEAFNFNQVKEEQKLKLTFTKPAATVMVYASMGKFAEKPNWVESMHYREENARGELDTDDIYQPGHFYLQIDPKKELKLALACSASEASQEAEGLLQVAKTTADFENLLTKDLDLRVSFLNAFYNKHESVQSSDWLNWILMASDSFVVQDAKESRSVIAGYFWFESWGRDTFISLPGLMLVTARFEDARYVLLNFSHHCKKGLIPNIILDTSGQPLYNTVDGTLWYINAVLQYLKYTNDFSFVKNELWQTLKSIIEYHEIGTEFQIHQDDDGLIAHGSRLTWMDASIEGEAVTPRSGKAVEVQALWYNALRIVQLLAKRFNETSLEEKYSSMADRVSKSFNEKFWNSQRNCLFDVLEDTVVDLSLRPNQIIAASLDFTMLDNERSTKIVDFVQEQFLTPCGLRTLSRGDSRYKGTYAGSMKLRDQAYHNGAVWPWLLGPFVKAYVKTGKPIKNSEFDLDNLIPSFFEKQIYEAGLGVVSEIFDGDPPHTPRGCISQAWSVAEPLRAYIEDILKLKPKYEDDILHA
jgi:predicted glycogen debranching enzyme